MMEIFVTGATGFLGSYVATELLRTHQDVELSLLVRAKDEDQAIAKLWKAFQLHMASDEFHRLRDRIHFVFGDLHAPDLGIAPKSRAKLVKSVDSIIHIAASLNRKSAKACLNTNLRGTLSVLKLARAIQDDHGLRRYSHVSTVAVAGHRKSEVVTEDAAIDWERSDYDPYGRTKKFCEHMARELLPDVDKTFFRPSTVMGDSRFAETTQFDMVRAFCTMADLPLVPLRPGDRLDIVNADWVGYAVATLHMKARCDHDIYHLSSGLGSKTFGEIAEAMSASASRKLRFAPRLLSPFSAAVNAAAGVRRKNVVSLIGTLLKVFLPYITYDTVFDNQRAVDELGVAPTPFTEYCGDLYTFAKGCNYSYPYRELPPPAASAEEAA